MRWGSGLSGGSSGPGQHNTSNPQCRPARNWVQKSAGHRCPCAPGSSHRSQTAHRGYDPRDAVLGGLLPEQILETRLSEVIVTATSTNLSAPDSDEQAMAKVYVPRLTDQSRLRRPKDTPPSKSACHQVTWIEDLCHAPGLPQVALPPGRERGKCPDTARFLCQRSETTRQQSLGGRWAVPMLWLPAEATRGHYACVHAVVCRPWLPLLSQDAVRPWTCAWPSPLQQQPAEMLHWRHSIVNCRITEMKSEN